MKPAEKKKKVLIAGSGPAGMEAARVAALRGHEVILYEREHRLGVIAGFSRSLVKGS
jgi:NADPH-dependent 2,4-dienoyl-CoA reductase/sulfur reductase-like enzyme